MNANNTQPLPSNTAQANSSNAFSDVFADQQAPLQNSDSDPSQALDYNQLTVSSQNQLTTSSVRSIGSNLDIDECIKRLLEVGMEGKIHKSVCFRNSEIAAICKAAQEVFLSQPVSAIYFLIKALYLHTR